MHPTLSRNFMANNLLCIVILEENKISLTIYGLDENLKRYF